MTKNQISRREAISGAVAAGCFGLGSVIALSYAALRDPGGMADIAIHFHGMRLEFSADQKKFTNQEAANALFHRSSRKGWELPV
jgi:hypothetical protein